MDKKSLRLTQAVERTHFLSQPVFIPFINGKELFSLPGDPAAEVGYGQTGGLTPDAAEFMDTICHGVEQFCAD